MKKLIFTLLSFIAFNLANAQCSVEPWSLEKRVTKSTLIIEGKVLNKACFWDNSNSRIYTINTIEVYKTFKGSVATSTINLVTEGGTVGLKNLTVHPSLELEVNETGLFLLKSSAVAIQDYILYKPSASIQSFLPYNFTNFMAYDWQGNYLSISHDLYETIKGFTGENFVHIKNFNPDKGKSRIRALANPVISSFSLDTVTSGTSTLLTINGSNFGFARGAGSVGFKDANFGDGRYYYPPTDWSYDSWSNSQIKIYVPSRAGTGKVQVTNNGGESGESSSDLYIAWSHLNILYPLSAGDTQFFEIDHVNRNGSGGYTWQFTNNFASNSAATAAFTRSLEEWRCETQMNWSLGANTSNDSRASDDDNIVRFTNFGDGKLGVCYSYRSGCFSGGSINWYTTELDIEFDSTYNWYYGTGTPPSGFYDFETVATHELGHGHQLGHVRDISKVMHFSIGPATRKAALVPEDIAAGVYVKDKSIASSPCGPSPMQAIPSGSCNLTPPISDFTISDTVVCPLDNVVFTNTTVGDPTSYAWNFSSQASPTTANTVGPHTVQFSSAGTHTIQLITSNSFGSDTVQKTITVKTATLASPGDFVSNDSGCLGFEDYTINAVTNAEGYQWTLSSGGTFVGATDQTTAQVEWTAAGQHIINVVAANECTVSDAQKDTVLIIASPTASFVGNDNSTTISFTNSSTNAETHYWEFGDGSTSTEDNPVHQYPDKGNYIVKYKVTNLCGADSVTQEFTLDFSAGINKVDRTWKLFPNPVQANSTLTVEGIAFDSYTLTDMNGRVIENQKANGNTVLVPSVNPGIYQIVIRKNQKQAVYSVVLIE